MSSTIHLHASTTKFFKAKGENLAELKAQKTAVVNKAMAELYRPYNFSTESDFNIFGQPQTSSWSLYGSLCATKNLLIESLIKYMMGYWLAWYAMWAITGLTVATSTVAIGLTFGLPLIPVILHIGCKVFESKAEKTHIGKVQPHSQDIYHNIV